MTHPAGGAGGAPEFVEEILDDATQPEPDRGTASPAASPGDEPSATPGGPATPSSEQEPPQPGTQPAPPPPEGGQAASPQAPGAAADAYPPLAYRAGGEEFEIPGSAVGEDGAFIPREVLGEVSRLISQGVYHERHWQQELRNREAQATERVRAAEQKAAEAEAILSSLDRLRQAGPEKMAEWLDGLERNWPLLMAEAKNQLLERQLQESSAAEQERQQIARGEELAPQIEDTLVATVEQLVGMPQYQGLDGEQFLRRLVQTRLDQIFTEAEYDDPSRGIRAGDVLVDYDVITSEADHEMGLLRQAAAAAKRNAAVLAPSGTPPTVGAGGTPAPSAERERPKFKSREEMEHWLESGAWKQTYG